MVEKSGKGSWQELKDLSNEEESKNNEQPTLLLDQELLSYPVNVPDDIHRDLNWDQP